MGPCRNSFDTHCRSQKLLASQKGPALEISVSYQASNSSRAATDYTAALFGACHKGVCFCMASSSTAAFAAAASSVLHACGACFIVSVAISRYQVGVLSVLDKTSWIIWSSWGLDKVWIQQQRNLSSILLLLLSHALIIQYIVHTRTLCAQICTLLQPNLNFCCCFPGLSKFCPKSFATVMGFAKDFRYCSSNF